MWLTLCPSWSSTSRTATTVPSTPASAAAQTPWSGARECMAAVSVGHSTEGCWGARTGVGKLVAELEPDHAARVRHAARRAPFLCPTPEI
eukprot:1010896-Rhodomonas_salina.1